MLNFSEYLEEGKRGLWDNIHAKRKRIKAGSGERMRKAGEKGRPTSADFKASQNEEVELDEAMSPQQDMDFRKMMAGAMSRAAYNAKWKKPLKSDSKVIYGKNFKEELIHVGHRNSKGDWVKTSTHSDYPDAKKAMADLEKQGKKGVQHRYDNAGSIDPGMRKLSHEELSADEQFDLIEEVIEQLAEDNGIDSESIWETLETVDDTELLEYAIDAKGHKSSTGGLTQKGVDAYNAKTGGNLKTAVTTPPSKLKPGSKAANRRKSFCARMGGVKGPMKDDNGRPTRKALSLRKWDC